MNLYPFQAQAVRQMLHFLEHNETHSCYNASEMGVGKTPMAIEAAIMLLDNHMIGPAKILVLCPSIMRLVWKDEIEAWKAGECQVISSSKEKLKESKSHVIWKVISYDLSYRPPILKQLEAYCPDVLICDEAHYLSNHRAKRTRAALANIFPKAKYHILLSGTPFTTRIVQGFSVFHTVAPSIFPDFTDFANKYSYCKRVPWGRGLDYFGVKNAPELSGLIRNSFYLRYTKEQVLKELPPKTYQKITLPSTLAVQCVSKDEKEKLKFELERIAKFISEGKPIPPPPKSLAEHMRLQGEAKITSVAEFVENLLDQEIPVVLYGWHKNVVYGFGQLLSKYNPVVITGETLPAKRHEGIKRFQSGATNLFIANIQAAGSGITLTRSSTVVFSELPWSPAMMQQGIDRCHRIGTTLPVTIYYFEVEKSLDTIVSSVVLSRARTFRSVLN